MRPSKRPSGPSGAHASPRIVLTVPADELAAWKAAAKRARMTLAAWVRMAGATLLAGARPPWACPHSPRGCSMCRDAARAAVDMRHADAEVREIARKR